MRAEPRRDTARVANGPQLSELRLAVEPVARLRLERRRSGAQHPADVLGERLPRARPRRPRGSRAPSTGSRLPVRAAPRTRHRPRAARTPRRGRPRSTRACGSRRDRGSPTARDRRSPRRRRRATRGRPCAPLDGDAPVLAEDVGVAASPRPRAAPRRGAAPRVRRASRAARGRGRAAASHVRAAPHGREVDSVLARRGERLVVARVGVPQRPCPDRS